MPKKSKHPYQTNLQKLRGMDCVIFQIGKGHIGGGTGIWHYRVKVPGSKKFLRKSTGTTDQATATSIAVDKYNWVLYRVKDDLPVHGKKFMDLAEEVIANVERKIARGHRSPRTLGNYTQPIRKYFKEFFKDTEIERIDEQFLDRYWDWRMDYYRTGPGKNQKRIHNQSISPKMTTLAHENVALRETFKLAERQGHIRRGASPEIKLPEKKATGAARTAFTEDEWTQLKDFMTSWAFKPQHRESDRWRRIRLMYLVLFLGETGVRVQEYKKLRWKDVTPYEHTDGKTYTRLFVRGKPGAGGEEAGRRRVIAPLHVLGMLREWQRHTPHTQPDDFVFANRKGQIPKYEGASYSRMVKEAGLFHDNEGRNRPLYCLRHTYATLRLIRGDVPIDVLADNMGHKPEELFSTYRHVSQEQVAHYFGGDETLSAAEQATRFTKEFLGGRGIHVKEGQLLSAEELAKEQDKWQAVKKEKRTRRSGSSTKRNSRRGRSGS